MSRPHYMNKRVSQTGGRGRGRAAVLAILMITGLALGTSGSCNSAAPSNNDAAAAGRAGMGGAAGEVGEGGRGGHDAEAGAAGHTITTDGGAGDLGGCALACDLPVATVQDLCLHSAAPPVAQGGLIGDGTYNLSSVDSYSLTDAGSDTCVDGYYRGTIIVAGTSWTRLDGSTCAVEQGTFSVTGSVVRITNQCPMSGTVTHSFTATTSSIVLIDGPVSQLYSRQ